MNRRMLFKLFSAVPFIGFATLSNANVIELEDQPIKNNENNVYKFIFANRENFNRAMQSMARFRTYEWMETIERQAIDLPNGKVELLFERNYPLQSYEIIGLPMSFSYMAESIQDLKTGKFLKNRLDSARV